MNYLQYVNLVATAAVLLTVVCAWINVRRALDQIKSQLPQHTMDHVHNTGAIATGGYTLWAYREGDWQLEKDYSEPGFACGPPPARTGWYEGEIVRTGSVRKPTQSAADSIMSTTA
jgi:hypothetical protein